MLSGTSTCPRIRASATRPWRSSQGTVLSWPFPHAVVGNVSLEPLHLSRLVQLAVSGVSHDLAHLGAFQCHTSGRDALNHLLGLVRRLFRVEYDERQTAVASPRPVSGYEAGRLRYPGHDLLPKLRDGRSLVVDRDPDDDCMHNGSLRGPG